MSFRCFCVFLAVGALSGCVFDSGPSIPEPGEVTNNENNDNSLITSDLAVDPITCSENEFPLFFPIPANVIGVPETRLRPESRFALGKAASTVRDREQVVWSSGFGWAHVTDGKVWVAGGSLVSTDEAGKQREYVALSHAEIDAVEGEVVTGFGLDDATGTGNLYSATVFTSERVLECTLRQQATESTCEENDGLQQLIVQNDVNPLARIELMPFLERPEPTVLRATIANLAGNMVLLGVGGRPGLRSVATIRAGFLGGNLAPLSIPTLTQGRDFYGARLSIGVTDESNGFPYLLMLAQDGVDASPEPAVFVSDGERYDVRELEGVDWDLHPDVAADSRTFSFVAKNSVRTSRQGLVVDFDAVRSASEFGYVGVGLQPDELILSIEEPLAGGESFLLHTNESEIVELGAGIGVRLFDDLVDHEPLVVFVDSGRDSLTVFRWDLSIGTEWVEGVGGNLGLDEIRDLQVPPVHFDDVSKIAFRARLEGAPIVGALFVTEVSGLERSLCRP